MIAPIEQVRRPWGELIISRPPFKAKLHLPFSDSRIPQGSRMEHGIL